MIFDRSIFPIHGWMFKDKTGWENPDPMSFSFYDTCALIKSHRMANKELSKKLKLSTDMQDIAFELEEYTKRRLT